MSTCHVCFRHCEIPEGGIGACGARTNRSGHIVAGNYARLTALALDPIEKKPLRRFHPGSLILSVGSYGCNLRCPFCQNHSISWSREALHLATAGTKHVSPEALVDLAKQLQEKGNIGLAFTYNEPLVGYEYVRDAAELAHEKGLVTVMVTNGTASLPVLEELSPHIDAMNIDLKGFTEAYYRDVLGGNLTMVKDFVQEAARCCHVELTTLIVPGENDTAEEMRALCQWVAGLDDGEGAIPLHISRFFPQFHMMDREATPVEQIYTLTAVAKEYLEYVYPGNV